MARNYEEVIAKELHDLNRTMKSIDKTLLRMFNSDRNYIINWMQEITEEEENEDGQE